MASRRSTQHCRWARHGSNLQLTDYRPRRSLVGAVVWARQGLNLQPTDITPTHATPTGTVSCGAVRNYWTLSASRRIQNTGWESNPNLYVAQRSRKKSQLTGWLNTTPTYSTATTPFIGEYRRRSPNRQLLQN